MSFCWPIGSKIYIKLEAYKLKDPKSVAPKLYCTFEYVSALLKKIIN